MHINNNNCLRISSLLPHNSSNKNIRFRQIPIHKLNRKAVQLFNFLFILCQTRELYTTNNNIQHQIYNTTIRHIGSIATIYIFQNGIKIKICRVLNFLRLWNFICLISNECRTKKLLSFERFFFNCFCAIQFFSFSQNWTQKIKLENQTKIFECAAYIICTYLPSMLFSE